MTDTPSAEPSPSTSRTEPVPSTSRGEPNNSSVASSRKIEYVKAKIQTADSSNDDSDTGGKNYTRAGDEGGGRQVLNSDVVVDLNCLQSQMV